MAEAIFEHKNVSCQYSHLSNILLVALRCSDKNILNSEKHFE